MESPSEIEQRITGLEVKLAFADDLLDQLNRTVYRQQQQIEQLARELVELRQRIPEEGATPEGVSDDQPPHY
jgi:SlyX protein